MKPWPACEVCWRDIYHRANAWRATVFMLKRLKNISPPHSITSIMPHLWLPQLSSQRLTRQFRPCLTRQPLGQSSKSLKFVVTCSRDFLIQFTIVGSLRKTARRSTQWCTLVGVQVTGVSDWNSFCRPQKRALILFGSLSPGLRPGLQICRASGAGCVASF